jgi:hypothetical protein
MQRDFIVDAAFGIHVRAENAADAIERFAKAPNSDKVEHMAYRNVSARPARHSSSVTALMVTVSRRGFSRSPWDSYVKTFRDHDGASAEEHFLTWWTSLAPDSYTRTVARVEIHRVIEGLQLIAGPDASELTACPAFPPAAIEDLP